MATFLFNKRQHFIVCTQFLILVSTHIEENDNEYEHEFRQGHSYRHIIDTDTVTRAQDMKT